MSAPRRPGGNDHRPPRRGAGGRSPSDTRTPGDADRPTRPPRASDRDAERRPADDRASRSRPPRAAAPDDARRSQRPTDDRTQRPQITRDRTATGTGRGGTDDTAQPGRRGGARSDGAPRNRTATDPRRARSATERSSDSDARPARTARTQRPAATDGVPRGRTATDPRRARTGIGTEGTHSERAAPDRNRAPRADAPRPARTRASGETPSRATADAAPRPAADARRTPQRIAKLLARAGIASRREIERMIADGRVAIDGKVLDTPATVIPSLHGVTVDGQAVQAAAPARLFLFNKPPGFLTTAHDPAGRPTIYDRLPADLPRVMPVGRLDMNTEGLLLLTTDGELKRLLELPSSGIPRLYRARAYGEVSQDQLEALIDGVEIEGVRYGQIDANLERRTGRNVWIEMRLTEGKNREVRRVLEYLGLQVSRLIRVAYGEFVLADLAPSGLVEVRQHDLVAFRQSLKTR